jgi:hypothetical protein
LLHAVVYLSWSVAAGQFHGQWGREYSGLLQVSLGLKFKLLSCGQCGGIFVNLAAASHFFIFHRT